MVTLENLFKAIWNTAICANSCISFKWAERRMGLSWVCLRNMSGIQFGRRNDRYYQVTLRNEQTLILHSVQTRILPCHGRKTHYIPQMSSRFGRGLTGLLALWGSGKTWSTAQGSDCPGQTWGFSRNFLLLIPPMRSVPADSLLLSVRNEAGFKAGSLFHHNFSHRLGQERLIQTKWLLLFPSFSILSFLFFCSQSF